MLVSGRKCPAHDREGRSPQRPFRFSSSQCVSHKHRPERQRGDLQLGCGELDFKIPVGLLSLDGQQVLGYMSLRLKVKAKVRCRLRREQDEGGYGVGW